MDTFVIKKKHKEKEDEEGETKIWQAKKNIYPPLWQVTFFD